MIHVIKRDGEVVDFTLSKISGVIKKAFVATKKGINDDILDLLALRVTADFQGKITDGKVNVEDIQDSVEPVSYTHLIYIGRAVIFDSGFSKARGDYRGAEAH